LKYFYFLIETVDCLNMSTKCRRVTLVAWCVINERQNLGNMQFHSRGICVVNDDWSFSGCLRVHDYPRPHVNGTAKNENIDFFLKTHFTGKTLTPRRVIFFLLERASSFLQVHRTSNFDFAALKKNHKKK